jgi:hypothetical protein
MATAIRWGRPLLSPKVFRLVTFASSLILIGFGLMLATQMMGI